MLTEPDPVIAQSVLPGWQFSATISLAGVSQGSGGAPPSPGAPIGDAAFAAGAPTGGRANGTCGTGLPYHPRAGSTTCCPGVCVVQRGAELSIPDWTRQKMRARAIRCLLARCMDTPSG